MQQLNGQQPKDDKGPAPMDIGATWKGKGKGRGKKDHHKGKGKTTYKGKGYNNTYHYNVTTTTKEKEKALVPSVKEIHSKVHQKATPAKASHHLTKEKDRTTPQHDINVANKVTLPGTGEFPSTTTTWENKATCQIQHTIGTTTHNSMTHPGRIRIWHSKAMPTHHNSKAMPTHHNLRCHHHHRHHPVQHRPSALSKRSSLLASKITKETHRQGHHRLTRSWLTVEQQLMFAHLGLEHHSHSIILKSHRNLNCEQPQTTTSTFMDIVGFILWINVVNTSSFHSMFVMSSIPSSQWQDSSIRDLRSTWRTTVQWLIRSHLRATSHNEMVCPISIPGKHQCHQDTNSASTRQRKDKSPWSHQQQWQAVDHDSWDQATQTFGCSTMKDTSSEFTNDSGGQCSHHTAPIAPSTQINLRTTGRPSSNNQVNQPRKLSTAAETQPRRATDSSMHQHGSEKHCSNPSRVHQQSSRPNQQQQRWSKQNMHLQHQTNMIPEHHPHHKQPWRRTSIHKHHSWEQQAGNQQDAATSQIHHKWKEHQITGSEKEDCGNESTSYHATLSTDQRQQREDHPDDLTLARVTFIKPTNGSRPHRIDDERTTEPQPRQSTSWTGSTNFEEKATFKEHLESDGEDNQQAIKARATNTTKSSGA